MPTAFRRWKAISDDRTAQMRFLVDLVASEPDVLDAIQVLDTLCDEATWLRSFAVKEAKMQGASWEEIGTALGISRQAAWERFKTMVEPRPTNSTAITNNGTG